MRRLVRAATSPRNAATSVAPLLAAVLLPAALATGCSSDAEPTAADVGYSEPISTASEQPNSLPSSLDTKAADAAASDAAGKYDAQVEAAIEDATAEAEKALGVYFTHSWEGDPLQDYVDAMLKHSTEAFSYSSLEVFGTNPSGYQRVLADKVTSRGVVENLAVSDEVDPNLGLLVFDANVQVQEKTTESSWENTDSHDLLATMTFEDGRWLLSKVAPDED